MRVKIVPNGKFRHSRPPESNRPPLNRRVSTHIIHKIRHNARYGDKIFRTFQNFPTFRQITFDETVLNLPKRGGGTSRVDFGRRRVSRRFWEAARLVSLLGDGASRVAFGRRHVSRCFWEAARLVSLLGGGASRVAFGRRRVSRCFWEAARLALLWEAARLASILGGVASRVASQEIPLPRRGGEQSETGWFK